MTLPSDAQLDDAVRRVLAELMLEGDPYTSIPLIDPTTDLPPAATVDAIRSGLADAADVASLDTLVTSGRLSESELNATIAATGAALFAPIGSGGGRRWGFVGDSNTEGSYTTSFSASFVQRTVDIAGADVCRMDSFEFGTSGWTSTQIKDHFLAFLVDGSSEAFVILAGTNDAPGGGGSVATALATSQANITAMCEAARVAGKKVVLCTIPPRSTGTAAENKRHMSALNTWIRLTARTLGAEVADHFAAVVDPATGAFDSTYTADDVHYNDQGAMRVAQVTAAAMRRCFPDAQSVSVSDVLPASLVTDAMNTRATVLSSSWAQIAANNVGTPSYAIEDDDTGYLDAGAWASVTVTGSASGALFAVDSPAVSSAQYAPGDIVAVVGKAQAIVTSGDWPSEVAADAAGVRFRVLNNSSAELANMKIAGRDMGGGRFDIGPIMLPFTIAGTEPASVLVRTYLYLNSGVAVKLRWQFTLVNLTELGISSLAPSAAVSRP